jgi:hypothetical protein
MVGLAKPYLLYACFWLLEHGTGMDRIQIVLLPLSPSELNSTVLTGAVKRLVRHSWYV